MSKRISSDFKKLDERQKYLLDRLPKKWDLNGYHAPQEPVEVKRARKLIERWDKHEARRQCEAEKRNLALLRKAREAVYFSTPEKALAIVRQCEKLLKPCS